MSCDKKETSVPWLQIASQGFQLKARCMVFEFLPSINLPQEKEENIWGVVINLWRMEEYPPGYRIDKHGQRGCGRLLVSGAQIRAARRLLGWTVRDPARRAVVSISTVNLIEDATGFQARRYANWKLCGRP